MWVLCDELWLSTKKKSANSIKVKQIPIRTKGQTVAVAVSPKKMGMKVKWLMMVKGKMPI